MAYTIALLLSATLGTAAYLRFGDHVAGNVLLDFTPTTSCPSAVGEDGQHKASNWSLRYWPLMVSWISYACAPRTFLWRCPSRSEVVVCSFAFIMVPCRLAALDVFSLRWHLS